MQDNSNVLKFPDQNFSLLSQPVRKKMEAGISGLTDKPEEIVQTIEQIFCSIIVAKIRQLATFLGRKAGDKVGRAFAANDQ